MKRVTEKPKRQPFQDTAKGLTGGTTSGLAVLPHGGYEHLCNEWTGAAAAEQHWPSDTHCSAPSQAQSATGRKDCSQPVLGAISPGAGLLLAGRGLTLDQGALTGSAGTDLCTALHPPSGGCKYSTYCCGIPVGDRQPDY